MGCSRWIERADLNVGREFEQVVNESPHDLETCPAQHELEQIRGMLVVLDNERRLLGEEGEEEGEGEAPAPEGE